MQFTALKEKLLNATLLAERIVGKKESLPVLSCVLLTAEKNFSVRATNLEAGVEVVVPGEIVERGIVAVPAGVFSQTLRSLASDKVILKLEGGNLLIESKGTKTLIKAVPHGEFPNFGAKDGDLDIKMMRETFLGTLQAVSYAASPSMIRPELGSIFMSISDGKLVTVATDSFRLAEKTAMKAVRDGKGDVLVPLKHALEITHILERMSDEEVDIGVEDAQLVVKGSGVSYTSRVVDAPFPNYKEIIPKNFLSEATVLKADLVETLRKARVFAGSEQKVGFHIYPKKKVFDVMAQSASIGEMSDSMDAALSGEDIDINFNISYVADCLPNIESDSITLNFSGTGRPLVIRGTSDPSFTYLVMPLNR